MMPILHTIIRKPELWDQDKCRTTFKDTPHGEANDILLRFSQTDKDHLDKVGDELEAVDRDVMKEIPGAKMLATNILQLVNGTRLGRVVITRLEPGKKILAHADVMGDYSKYYSRYHVVLQGLPGSLFNCGDETVNMLTGQVWWFDASSEHSVSNNSKDDRVHMMVDVRVDP